MAEPGGTSDGSMHFTYLLHTGPIGRADIRLQAAGGTALSSLRFADGRGNRKWVEFSYRGAGQETVVVDLAISSRRAATT